MRTFDRIKIGSLRGWADAPHRDAVRVYGAFDGEEPRHIGYLMPPLPDSRQQPKALAVRLREELNRRAAARTANERRTSSPSPSCE